MRRLSWQRAQRTRATIIAQRDWYAAHGWRISDADAADWVRSYANGAPRYNLPECVRKRTRPWSDA